jgi:hypothetical protein
MASTPRMTSIDVLDTAVSWVMMGLVRIRTTARLLVLVD